MTKEQGGYIETLIQIIEEYKCPRIIMDYVGLLTRNDIDKDIYEKFVEDEFEKYPL